MATWRDLRAIVKSSRYEITKDEPGMIQLIFDIDNGRSQVVYLWHRRLVKGTEDWLVIESAFAHIDEIDLGKALDEAGNMVCGGVVAVGDSLVYRHAVPLANLDVNEFRRPLELVTLAADRLEHRLGGGDAY